MPELTEQPPLNSAELAGVRDILAEWPHVKSREPFTQWITGVLARHPKMSNALTGLIMLACGAVAAWLTGLMTPAPATPAPASTATSTTQVSPTEAKPAEPPGPVAPKKVMPTVPPTQTKRMPPAATNGTRPSPAFVDAIRSALATESEADKTVLPRLVDVYRDMSDKADNPVFVTGTELRAALDSWERLHTTDKLPRVRSVIAAEVAATLPTGTLDDAARAKCRNIFEAVASALGAIVGDVGANQPKAVQADDGWVTYRALSPDMATGVRKLSGLNALERKVK